MVYGCHVPCYDPIAFALLHPVLLCAHEPQPICRYFPCIVTARSVARIVRWQGQLKVRGPWALGAWPLMHCVCLHILGALGKPSRAVRLLLFSSVAISYPNEYWIYCGSL